MPAIVLDVFESPKMEEYLAKTLQVTRHNMVSLGFADVMWNCGHTVTLEHKTIEQAMTEMGGRLDDQLRKHSQHADEVGLIIDGMATPVENEQACYLWQSSRDGKLFTRQSRRRGKTQEPRKVHVSWEAFQAYLWRLDKEGFTVYQSPTLESLCLAVSAFVHNSMKSEHKSLRRYVKTKPVIWEEQDKPIYHHIRTLMVHSGVGEQMARRLLDAYGTPFNVYMANPWDGLWPAGEVVFNTIQRDLGRTY
jgi:hypothetical protein